MNLHVAKAERTMKLFFIELSLAKDTAYDVYFSQDPHVIWHCFHPFLGQRSLHYVRSGILQQLIPNVRVRQDWIHLLPLLEDGLKILNLLDDEYRQGCRLCQRW